MLFVVHRYDEDHLHILWKMGEDYVDDKGDDDVHFGKMFFCLQSGRDDRNSLSVRSQVAGKANPSPE